MTTKSVLESAGFCQTTEILLSISVGVVCARFPPESSGIKLKVNPVSIVGSWLLFKRSWMLVVAMVMTLAEIVTMTALGMALDL